MTAARSLAGFAASLSDSSIPAPVRHAAKRHILDAIGVALAAAGTGAAAPVVDAVRAWAGTRESSVIGAGIAAPAPAAALANGVLIHALDFDDTHVESLVHPSAVVVPPALAIAEETGASGTSLITACVIGYEIVARIGAAAAGKLHQRGFDVTGLAGTFAAAAVAGRLWGLDADHMTNAFGIAGSQSSGLFAALADGTEAQRFHAGWAAHGGIVAADLARRGMAGPEGVLDGPNGFFPAFLKGEAADLPRLQRGLGYDWESLRIAIKPYPASHFVHAYMDAAKRMRVRAGDIEEVVCAVPEPVVGIVCEPRAEKISPSSSYGARFSLPFAVAVALVGGREGLDLFDADALADRRVLGLAERVRYEIDPTLSFPRSYGGKITVLLRDGRERSLEEPVNRGHPDRPLDDDDVRAKFFANARKRLDEAATTKLADAVEHLGELDTVIELAELAQGN